MAQIKKDTSLRKAILQAAITGQLISNVEGTTETGKELLDRIIEERNNKLLAEWKEALKKNPNAKKPVTIVASEIDEEEIPFEIPENWCWCRLGDLFTTSSGTTPASKNPNYYLNGSINWVRTTDLNNGVLTSTEIKITEKAKEDCNLKIIPQDSVCIALYGGAGTIGKNALIKFDTTINQSVCAIHPNGFCSMKYIQWFMQWQRPNWMDMASGSRKDPNINQIIVKGCLIPIPPVDVQNTIVSKLEQVLPLVDDYENAILQKEQLKNTLPERVKKAILQEAITGQLTETWRKTANIKENGTQLLDRIIEERNAKALAEWEEALKKNPKAKKLTAVVAGEIKEEDIPFELPENWCWCRLGDVGDWGAGTTPNRSKREYYSNEGIPWIKTGELNNGIVISSEEFITEKALKECSLRYNKVGDVMIAMYGATIGKVAIAGIELTTNQACCACTPYNGLYNKYLFYFLMANKENFINQGEGGAQPNISREKIVKTLIPLPPLEEQENIVKKVEELLPLCK